MVRASRYRIAMSAIDIFGTGTTRVVEVRVSR
jgi:hypothetical protein